MPFGGQYNSHDLCTVLVVSVWARPIVILIGHRSDDLAGPQHVASEENKRMTGLAALVFVVVVVC